MNVRRVRKLLVLLSILAGVLTQLVLAEGLRFDLPPLGDAAGLSRSIRDLALQMLREPSAREGLDAAGIASLQLAAGQ